jgi:hypothetical protein
MNVDQLIQIVMLGALVVIVAFVMLISNHNNSYQVAEPINAADVPCTEYRAKTHRKAGLTKLMNCIAKFNGIELLNDKKATIYSSVTRDKLQQDIWAIEQVVYDTQCRKETKVWEVDSDTMVLLNEKIRTVVC